MSKNTKITIAALSALGNLMIAIMIMAMINLSLETKAVSDESQSQVQWQCPEGTQPIGANGCKITPTGCPFGDSIPLEKCTDCDGNPWPYEDEAEDFEPVVVEQNRGEECAK